jgi:hypothetical protein
MTGPTTFDEASAMPWPDVLNRHQALTDRDLMARAIATLQARGEWNDDRHLRPEDYPPLTVAEHLELIALGERIARYYRHPALVHHAVIAGATWEQIAGAAGTSADQARQDYQAWAEGQRQLRGDFPGGTIGLGEDEYAAALEAAGSPQAGPVPAAVTEETRRLDAIRGVLDRFDWEFDDRQLALEAIDRIAEGGQP